MRFAIGTASSSLSFEETHNLIKSSLLYADEIELIGMVEYAVFKYLPGRVNSVKDIDSLIDSLIPFFKSVEIEETKTILIQLESIRNQIDLYKPYLSKKKKRSKQEILAQIQLNKAVDEGKDALLKSVSQITDTGMAHDIKRLIDEGIVYVFDYLSSDFNFDELVGGYFGNLIGVIKNHMAYPLFDKTSNEVISSFSKKRIIDLGNIDQAVLVHAGIATKILMTLPTLEKASIDEILDFKKDMQGPLHSFKKAIYEFSDKIKSRPWDEDFQYDFLKVYYAEVMPKVEELNALASETSVLKNMGKRVLADEEIRRKTSWAVGGLATTVTTTSNMLGALNVFKEWFLGLSMLVVAPNVASAFFKTLSIRNDAKDDVKIIDKQMRGNEMYYYYKAMSELC